MTKQKKKKKTAPMNRTISLSLSEKKEYRRNLITLKKKTSLRQIKNKVVLGDAFKVLDLLPEQKYDLLFVDPPYNLTKKFGKNSFKETSIIEYENWLDEWLKKCVRLMRPTASVYICGDWRSSSAIQTVGMKYFTLRNRITWEREKGRGAKTNWKNSLEDIWFFTVSNDYFFDVEAVKMKRKVIAPYKKNGKPKDWTENDAGKFRITFPSNLWTDLSVPFWSMPENTEHPTQKPEKLLAKIILASTKEKDLILDPFSGSGTTAVAAKKLKRNFTCIEADEHFCLLTEKRLDLAGKNKNIQGFSDGVFWERNSNLK